jgi:hypothetical protein
MNHPYAEFENTKLWKTIDLTLTELEKNQDVKIETAREYVIGRLCENLHSAKVLSEKKA